MTKNKKLTYFLVLCVGFFSIAVNAAVMFGHDQVSGNDTLYEIDTTAQSITAVGSENRPSVDIELAYDQTTIYASDYYPSLDLLDSTTGLRFDYLALTNLPGSTDSVTALELIGTALYAVFSEYGDTFPNYFGIIDVTTGAVTSLSLLPIPIAGMHYAEDALYAVSGSDFDPSLYSNLYIIDPSTGATSLVAPITLNGHLVGEATGLAYLDRSMYLTRNLDSTLYSISLETGVLTPVFDTGTYLAGLTAAREASSNQISIKNGFIKLDTTVSGNSPFAADCSNSAHYGRMTLDAEGIGTLFVCTESGWQQK